MSEVQSTPVNPPTTSRVPEVAVVQPVQYTVEQPAAEAVPETASEVKREDKPDSSSRRFAELSRRQRELVQREQALKAQAEKVEPIAKAVEEARASKNPAKVLEAAGFSLDDVIEWYAAGGEETPAAPEKSVEEIVEEKLEAKRREEAEAERVAKVEKQISDFKANIKSTAESGGDAYELVNRFAQHDLVYDVVLQHHAESGEVLPIEEALRLVEEHLFSQVSGIKKIQAKAPEPTPQASLPSREPRTPPFTLSSREAAPTQVQPQKKMTRDEAREAALAALRFN